MEQKRIFIEFAKPIWKSPDGQRIINEVKARGISTPLKTYSSKIPAQLGQEIDVIIEKRPDRNGMDEYWLTSPQREGYGNAGGYASSTSHGMTPEREDSIIRQTSAKVAGELAKSPDEFNVVADMVYAWITKKPVQSEINPTQPSLISREEFEEEASTFPVVTDIDTTKSDEAAEEISLEDIPL